MKKIFLLILLLAFSLRYFGINWDQGHHLHPDERMIIMVVDRIHFPKTPQEWQSLFSPNSPLNPKFFAYGSFPIYLLKGVGVIFNSDNYDARLFIGRMISIVFELGTVILVFLIAKAIITPRGRKAPLGQRSLSGWQVSAKDTPGVARRDSPGVEESEIPLLAMFFYAISVLPIQSSHFFISDIPLTFFTTLVLYLSIKFIGLGKIIKISNTKYSILNTLLGIALGLSLATKITAILLIIPVFLALLIRLMRFRNIKSLLVSLLIIAIFSSLTFAITMPYAIFDFKIFRANNLEQSQMRVNPFVFPFTLQYVNTAPYWYFIKNIILWGMGLPLGLIAVTGTIYIIISWLTKIRQFVKKKKLFPPWDSLSILLIFFIVYFAFMGISAVKFMRYMLPLYPLLCVFGSFFLFHLIYKLKALKPKAHQGCVDTLPWCEKIRIDIRILALFFTLSMCTLWPLSFLSIYAKPHTRIAASEWIYENIPQGAHIALEHWDDGLPLGLPNKYKVFQPVEFPLYGVDDKNKWEIIANKLQTVDYIIISSNRLYVPLMRLTDCVNLPKDRCYTITARYYEKLFNGQLGFTKVAEFASNPKIQIANFSWEINDQGADESFTVYDHPKIMIFRKEKSGDYFDLLGLSKLSI